MSTKTPILVTLEFDPEEMARRGRIGAYRRWATHDPREGTAPARAAFLAKFEREVDPCGVLPEEERRRRAESARKAHFARLARLSAKARRGRQNAAASLARKGEPTAIENPYKEEAPFPTPAQACPEPEKTSAD